MAHPVGKITRLGFEGFGVRRAGSFAGKTPSTSHPHPVGRITRFGMEGYGVRRAGSFGGKTAATNPPDVTGVSIVMIASPGRLMCR